MLYTSVWNPTNIHLDTRRTKGEMKLIFCIIPRNLQAPKQSESTWKYVPRSLIDKERTLKSCHDNSAQGELLSRY